MDWTAGLQAYNKPSPVFNRHLRIQYLSKYYYTWPSIRKFKQLMSCKSRKVLLNLSKYLIDAFLIRKC